MIEQNFGEPVYPSETVIVPEQVEKPCRKHGPFLDITTEDAVLH